MNVLKRLTFLKWPCCIAAIALMVWCVVTGLQVYHYAAALLIMMGVGLMDLADGGNVIKSVETEKESAE